MIRDLHAIAADRIAHAGGVSPAVDAAREESIMLKLARGQHFLTRHDGWFLLARLDQARRGLS